MNVDALRSIASECFRLLQVAKRYENAPETLTPAAVADMLGMILSNVHSLADTIAEHFDPTAEQEEDDDDDVEIPDIHP